MPFPFAEVRKLLIASSNPGKIREITQAFKSLSFQIVEPKQFKLLKNFKVAETGKTFEENAILKAEAYGEKSGLLSLAEDTGLVIKALAGKPGVYSNRYGATAKERNDKVIQEMKNINNRSAYFKSVIAIYDPKTDKFKTCTGKTYGYILKQTKGTSTKGLGYDSIFFSPALNRSFAQASTSEKNRVSHRGKALTKAVSILYKWHQ